MKECLISTIFTRDIKSRNAYIKKEIISNINAIFYAAIPILKHFELKKEILYDKQIIHRLALPLKIGTLVFLVMITVKERIDYVESKIDEFSVYDLYSEAKFEPEQNEKSSDSSSTASAGNYPVTSRSHYRMITYSISDLIAFVKFNIMKTRL